MVAKRLVVKRLKIGIHRLGRLVSSLGYRGYPETFWGYGRPGGPVCGIPPEPETQIRDGEVQARPLRDRRLVSAAQQLWSAEVVTR